MLVVAAVETKTSFVCIIKISSKYQVVNMKVDFLT